jgi:hypothetical protein
MLLLEYRKSTSRCTQTMLAAALILALAAAQAPVFVDDGATGANDGSSWADAFVELQSALAVVTAGEIWVAEGRYLAGAPGNRGASFTLRDGVALYGSFQGWESSVAQRAGSAELTVLDGDLLGNDAPSWLNRSENTIHVVRAENVGASAVLDGFRIRGGTATTSSGYDSVGGGMLLLNASPTLRDCIVEDCLSNGAGGVYLNGGSPSFADCELRDNWGYSANGGGLYQLAGSAVLTDCAFRRNRGSNSTQGGGGGLYVAGGTVDARGCLFEQNVANEYYGVFYGAVGGGVLVVAGGSTFRDCRFVGNRSHTGAGAGCYADATFINCSFTGNEVYSVDTGSGSVGGYGGAVMTLYHDVRLIGCSIFGNDAQEDCGGLYAGYGSRVSIESSVLWGNTDLGSTEILKRNLKKDASALVEELWSCIEGLPDAGTAGCIALDPRFADPDGLDGLLGTPDDDLRLRVGSPCIDAGSNAGFAGVATDLEGLPRRADDVSIWDRGLGAAPIADMGAHEFAGHGPLLALSVLQRGQPAVLTVTGAEPFESVDFFLTFRGLGVGPVYPQYGGMALDLRAPLRALGARSADAAGTATFTKLLPANVALRTVTIQAAIARGVGGADSMRTNPATATIQP